MCSVLTVNAQQKGSYLNVQAGIGPSGLNYDLKGATSNGDNQLKVGANALIGYSYFFNRHWGLGTGVGFSCFNSRGLYKNDFSDADYFNLGNQIGNNNGNDNEYELRARLAHWEEKQSVYTLDIPLMIQYQYKFGDKEGWGIYFGIGVKLHIPLKSEYEVIDSDYSNDGRLNVSGLFHDSNIDYGSPSNYSISYHGFGTIHNPNEKLDWNGDIDLKLGISGIADLGFLFSLSRRIDLTVGGYLNYGFNDVKKGNSKPLMEAPEQYLPSAENNVGNGITYNGMINSDRVNKANFISYGGKIGLRIKLGKIEHKEKLPVECDTCSAKVELIGLDKLIQKLDSLPRQEPQIVTQYIEANAKAIECLSPEEQKIVLQKIYFDTNKSFLSQESKNVLDQIADILKAHQNIDLKIFGNTDDVANDQINIPLGLRRAQAARDYLVTKGIAKERMSTYTQSSYTPVVPNTDAHNRSLNRSAEFVVVME
jgi:outer membrane protein OmpA-like peptidoglycan-associated protein